MNSAQFFGVGLGCTVLTIIGFVFSPSDGGFWLALVNRGLTVFSIWVTAGLCLLFLHVEEEREVFARRCERPHAFFPDEKFSGSSPW